MVLPDKPLPEIPMPIFTPRLMLRPLAEGILRQQHQLDEGLVDELHYGLLAGEPLPTLDVTW